MTDHCKRIAIFLPSLEGGGAQGAMITLAKGFLDLGNQVDIVLVKAKGEYLKNLPSTVNVVDLDSKHTSSSLPKLLKYLKVQSPHLLIATMNVPNVIALIAKFLHRGNTRFLIREATTVSLHLNKKSFKHYALRLLIKYLYPRSDVIVAVSEGVAEDLKSFCRLNTNRLKIINNPVIIPTDIPEIPNDIIREWLHDKSIQTILGVGRLAKEKNYELLIRAFAKVKDQVNGRLVILGEGSRRRALEDLIKELDIGSSVAMPGFRDNPYAYMVHANLFILSSLWEGFPNALLEALACGCPVISTECQSGPSEILDNGRYGILVPINDVDTMAEAIIATSACPQDRQRLINRACEFSLHKATLQYLQA